MSVLVVDASLVVDLAGGFPAADGYRHMLSSADAVAAPAHLDAEVLSAICRLERASQLTREVERVDALANFSASRWPARPLLAPVWTLIDRVATRDALYVALAVSMNATPITTDGRLRRGAMGIVSVADPTN